MKIIGKSYTVQSCRGQLSSGQGGPKSRPVFTCCRPISAALCLLAADWSAVEAMGIKWLRSPCGQSVLADLPKLRPRCGHTSPRILLIPRSWRCYNAQRQRESEVLFWYLFLKFVNCPPLQYDGAAGTATDRRSYHYLTGARPVHDGRGFRVQEHQPKDEYAVHGCHQVQEVVKCQPRQTSHECVYGVVANRAEEDLRGATRHAQRGDLQTSR